VWLPLQVLSSHNRNRSRPAILVSWRDFEARVEDLAKGLRDAFEADRQLVGPLMEDYRVLARTLGAEFARAH
jgi:hypothetical protein